MSKKEEGIRAFTLTLGQLDEGDFAGELSEAQHDLMTILSKNADAFKSPAKGSMTITLSYAVDPKGTVSIDADVKTKLPKTKRPRTQMFLTKGNNLSLENARQIEMKIRDVSVRETVRDVPDDADAAEVRSV